MLKSFLSIIIYSVSIFAQQEETHSWKVVDADDGTKFWYDASSLDTTIGDKFNIWILENHQPPSKQEGVEGEVFRSKTLYAINLTTAKYGILKVIYFDINNQEIFSYDYDNPPLPEDIKYTYPITDQSMLHFLVKELFEPKENKIK
ncbi:MAG: hypothetical protein ACHQLA_00820 [Ignavibacteriales bacterium]